MANLLWNFFKKKSKEFDEYQAKFEEMVKIAEGLRKQKKKYNRGAYKFALSKIRWYNAFKEGTKNKKVDARYLAKYRAMISNLVYSKTHTINYIFPQKEPKVIRQIVDAMKEDKELQRITFPFKSPNRQSTPYDDRVIKGDPDLNSKIFKKYEPLSKIENFSQILKRLNQIEKEFKKLL
jgi:hypothetical protein